jgi:hypothetical protein
MQGGYNKVPLNQPPQGAGGQDVQAIAAKFGGLWKMLFTTSGIGVVAAGLVAVLADLDQFPPDVFSCIGAAYLVVFGIMMLVLDAPIAHPAVAGFKGMIFMEARFLTRFTGRGLWYLFLSTLVIGNLWSTSLWFIGCALSAYMALVSIYALQFGYLLGAKLNKFHIALKGMGMDQAVALCPPHGFRSEAFGELAKNYGTVLTTDELSTVVAAMTQTVSSDDFISKAEYEAWVHGGFLMI